MDDNIPFYKIHIFYKIQHYGAAFSVTRQRTIAVRPQKEWGALKLILSKDLIWEGLQQDGVRLVQRSRDTLETATKLTPLILVRCQPFPLPGTDSSFHDPIYREWFHAFGE